MPLQIPNTPASPTPEQAAQGAPDSVDYSILGYADLGIGVITGCVVTAQSSPNATVQVSAGQVSVENAGYIVAAVSSLSIAANTSGNPRLDLVIYRVGTGIMVLQGTSGAAPYTSFTTPTWTTDVTLAGIYVATGFSSITSAEIILKAAGAQPSPMGSPPTLGAKIVGLGHSLMEGYGSVPWTHGFMSQIAGMMRARLWNQAVGGAVLAGAYPSGTPFNGFGGIPQVLQQYLAPKQPIQWLGAYSSTVYYTIDDGVTVGTGLTCSTSGSSTTLTTTGSYTTSNIVAGMVISGTGITPGTYVVKILTATTLQMSAAMTVSSETVTFTGWYRCAAEAHAVTPAGVGNLTNWNLVPAGQPSYFGGEYNAQSVLPIMMYGNNDIVHCYQRNPQPFLSSLQAMFARVASAMVWEDGNSLITLAGGTWTAFTYTSLGGAFGSGTQITEVPNTAAATITFQTPPDWTGGYVDMGFVLSFTTSVLASGTLNFTVDGSAVNCICSGMSPGSSVNFGSPNRQTIATCALGTALTNGVASGSTLTLSPGLPFAIGNGSHLVVGGVNGGTTQTYTTTASAVQGATSVSVTSQTANATYPVGTPVYDSTTSDASWVVANDVVVRVPVPAGSHQVVATVPASPSIANLYFDYVSFESTVQPIGLVFGLWKVANLFGMGGGCPTYQDIDTWNTDIAAVLGTGNEWPHVFVSIADVFMNTSPLGTALTLGQTGVTSLSLSSGLKVPITNGDTIQLGSGATLQYVVASASAAIGATSISITSFTSTYAQPIGTPVSDFTVACNYFYQDGVHPNPTGHALIASVVWQNIMNSLQTVPQLVAVQSQEAGKPTSVMNLASGTDLVVGSATVGGAWIQVVGPACQVAAEPGDVLEISVNGLYDAIAAVGSLDIVTFNFPAYISGNSAGVAAVINYVSGTASFGGNSTGLGLGYAAVGAQATNGLVAMYSPGASTTIPEPITGTFYYPVQFADIIGGNVYVGLVGRSSTTTVRHIKNATGYQLVMSAVNVGPVSYNAEA